MAEIDIERVNVARDPGEVVKYTTNRIRTLEPLKRIFHDKCDYTLNWLFLSTSGIHGSYIDLDQIESAWDITDEEAESYVGRHVTVLAVLPRMVTTLYGHVELESLAEVAWLRSVVEKTMAGVAATQAGNLPATEEKGD